MTGSWETAAHRRTLFEQSAASYDRLRPGYPDALYDDLERECGLERGADVVEVGSGTGLSTRGLVEHGWSVRCVEPAAQMAAIARERLGDTFDLVPVPFEDWEIAPGTADLVFSATAWMWVRQPEGFQRAAELLRPTGALGLAWQTLERLEPEGLQEGLEAVYSAIAPELGRTFTAQQTVHSGWPERIAEAGPFTAPQTFEYAFSRAFDARDFVEATFTYGMHGNLGPEGLGALADALAAVIDRDYGGRVERFERTFLYLSRPR